VGRVPDGGEIGRAAFEVTAPGGWFAAHGAPSGRFADVARGEAERRGVTTQGIQHVQMESRDRTRLAKPALSEAAAGRITPVIGQAFRWSGPRTPTPLSRPAPSSARP
jgi:NADPH:quinone reductase